MLLRKVNQAGIQRHFDDNGATFKHPAGVANLHIGTVGAISPLQGLRGREKKRIQFDCHAFGGAAKLPKRPSRANLPDRAEARNSVSSPEHQGENEVARIEQKELEEHRDEIIADVKKMVEKYRAIFDWNVLDIDQTVADKLILGEVRKALDEIEKKLLG